MMHIKLFSFFAVIVFVVGNLLFTGCLIIDRNMKKLLLLFLLTLSYSYSKAQVSYGDNFLVDYNVKINLSTENGSPYLTLILTSERLKMSDTPKLLLRLMDDSVISLEGYLLDSSKKSEGAYIIGNIALDVNYNVTEAKFPISKEQVESLSSGVKKLRLNTSPKFHEKEWRKDKTGKKLYNKYLESSSNSFEDGF